MKKVGDYQLLELKKNVFHVTSELRDIIDKITSFSKLVAYCGNEENHGMDELCEVRMNSTNAVPKLSNDLVDLIGKKDISEEKLTSSLSTLSLKIELPKFNRYDSDMDVYTFRAEFEKLIEPTIQEKLWPDYLKRNYLSGSALTLVEKIEGIEEIWKKLISSFGNMRILLHNKISSLKKQNGLWKVSGDEKIGIAIAAMLNTMFELVTLAKKFELEEELYHGGCFEHFLSLLGKCKDPNEKRPVAWVRLVEFLHRELELRKRFTIFEKSKKCLGIDSKQYSGGGSKRNQYCLGKPVNTVSNEARSEKICHICDKYGHAVTTNCIGQKGIPYFTWKTFIEMTTDDRRKVLFEKKLCAQCLEPGVKFNEEH